MKKMFQMMSLFMVLSSLALVVKPAQAQEQSSAAAGSGLAMQKQSGDQGNPAPVVNINTASLAEIMFLPGIGPSKAEAIIAYRNKHRFVRKSQLMRVHGIGPKSLRRLRPMITVKGPTTMTHKAHRR